MKAHRTAIRACAAALLLVAPGSAAAQTPSPDLGCDPPSFTGTPRDGSTLTGRAGECPPLADLRIRLRWFRCAATECVPVTVRRRSPLEYTLSPADVGSRMLLRQTVSVGLDTDVQEVRTEVVRPLPPRNLARPEISGERAVGETLQASPGFWSGTPTIRFAYQWRRCERTCADIPGAVESRYRVKQVDAGKSLRVVVTATNEAPRSGRAASPRTAIRAPATPLEPLTNVVVAGHVLARGARISELSIRGPRGASVEIRCRGRDCPFRQRRRVIRGEALRVRALERNLRAGTVIEIRVTQPGRIGKFTRIEIRRRRIPRRVDRCLPPGSRRPVRCS